MKSLKSKCLIIVWVVALPFAVSSQAISYLIARSQGFPNVKIAKLEFRTRMLAVMSNNLFGNIPDYFSIILYAVMWKRFKSTNRVGLKTTRANETSGQEGIWMGSNGIAIILESADQDSSRSSTSVNDKKHRAQQVLDSLKYHILLCLLDFLLSLVNGAVMSTVVGRYMMYFYHVFCCYWIPFLVIKTSLRQLDGMTMYIFNVLCNN